MKYAFPQPQLNKNFRGSVCFTVAFCLRQQPWRTTTTG